MKAQLLDDFLKACGAADPLQVEAEGVDTGEVRLLL